MPDDSKQTSREHFNLKIGVRDGLAFKRALNVPEPYELHPDALPNPSNPEGKLYTIHLDTSTVYPDVPHDMWLYVPAQYTHDQPASLMVFLDGLMYEKECRVTTILDNLIASTQIPTALALFIAPGAKGPGMPIYGGKDNRSLEYDTPNGDFAKFLAEDVLPIIHQDYAISTDPDQHLICGHSSGGIAAFAAAWFRPDLFRRVITHCGSFTAIRGGHEFPTWVRMTDKKPLRVWMSSGKKDLDVVFGNWMYANLAMGASLDYMGYDAQLHISEGGHSLKYAASTLPDALRWIWRS